MSDGIKIVLWNANGLAQRSLELKTFIKNQDIDIMLISETHFTHKNFLRIPQYSIYTTNHPDGKAHGGTAVIIRNKIKHYENEHHCKDFLQATNVTVEEGNGFFTVSAIYCPPKHTISKEKFTTFFKSLGHRFIAGGDYNAKHPWWGSRSSNPNPKGKQLYASMQAENLIAISTGEPTYWPTDRNKLPDLIDFAVVKGLNSNNFITESCYDLTSDHSPIIIKLTLQIQYIQNNYFLYNKKTNWETYKAILDEKISATFRSKLLKI